MGFIVKMCQLTKEKNTFYCQKCNQKASYVLVKVIFQEKRNDAPLWKKDSIKW